MSSLEDMQQDPDAGGGSLLVERNRMTLRERAADILRQAIIDQRFPPGTHLKERELCDMLGVSRTSVREALRHLESERLIETVPHKGPVVVTLTMQDARELYQVRAALEGLAGELFAAKASDQQIAELRRASERMADAVRAGQAGATLEIVAEFYKVLFDGSDNRVCAQFLQSLNSRISMLRRLSIASAGRSVAMLAEVDAIVDAAVRRDADALKRACIAHVEAACAAAMSQLAAEAEEAG